MSNGFKDALYFYGNGKNPWDEDTIPVGIPALVVPELKCECGIWITYGKSYPKHSEFCPIYKEDKETFDLDSWWGK